MRRRTTGCGHDLHEEPMNVDLIAEGLCAPDRDNDEESPDDGRSISVRIELT